MKCKKKVLSLLLAMCLMAGMLPMAAFAADETRTEQANAAALPFTDVSEGDWFYPYVKYAYEHGLMSGVSATTFGPQVAVNRAMVVQILYAQAGKPATSGESSFSDVKQGDWYYDAVVWAEKTGVTAGEDGKFNPNQSTTREQFAVMLYANAGKPAASGDLSGFADAASVSSWAQPGMTWANQNGLISGEQRNGAMYLNPQGLATRAQGATIFKGYNENVLNITEVARGTCGANLTWVLDSEGTLTISGTGKMDDWETVWDTPWYENKSQIKTVYIGDGVENIGERAFSNCGSMMSVTIGNSVASIGIGAFNNCIYLTGVTIPDSVTSIGERAFYDCNSLTSVMISDSVTSIGGGVFASCAGLTEIVVAADNAAYSSLDGALFNKDQTTLIQYPGGKSDTYVVPASVTSIYDMAFDSCEELTSVTIPDSVTSIGDYAFSGCENLTEMTIPDSVTSIGDWAFSSCGSMVSVTIGSGVISIGERVFYECYGLTSAIIGNGVTSIGSGMFESCNSLTSVTIPDSVTSIGDDAFSSCDSLTSVTIPASVTSIGEDAFAYCTSLTSVTIPDSVTSIGDGAFAQCNSLTNVIIGSSVTYIGELAFSCCDSLTSVTIGIGVTSIGESAFNACGNLTDVYYRGSEAQWAAIDIGDYNSSLLNATIHYNYEG